MGKPKVAPQGRGTNTVTIDDCFYVTHSDGLVRQVSTDTKGINRQRTRHRRSDYGEHGETIKFEWGEWYPVGYDQIWYNHEWDIWTEIDESTINQYT